MVRTRRGLGVILAIALVAVLAEVVPFPKNYGEWFDRDKTTYYVSASSETTVTVRYIDENGVRTGSVKMSEHSLPGPGRGVWTKSVHISSNWAGLQAVGEDGSLHCFIFGKVGSSGIAERLDGTVSGNICTAGVPVPYP